MFIMANAKSYTRFSRLILAAFFSPALNLFNDVFRDIMDIAIGSRKPVCLKKS